MQTSLRCAAALAMFTICLVAILGRADEPKAAVKKAVAAKPAQAEPKAVKKEEAQKPAAANEIDAQVDAQVQQWIPQFTQQYRPMLAPELNFIRQVCDLAPEQRPKIKAAGEAGVKAAVRKMAELQGRQMRGNVRDNTSPDPRRIIREALAKALQETLTPEQMAKYTEEVTQRTALRKRAAILSVVARLDGTLCLTAEQRDKITASITSGWQDKWEQWLMLSVYGDQYFPMVPDQLVVSHLNAEQKSVWAGLQKVEFGFFSRGGNVGDNDGWWGDEPANADAPVP